MKTIILVLIPFIVFASGVQLTPSEHSSIHNYNYKPSSQFQKKSKMHRLHNINEKDAGRIIQEQTGEEVESIKLIERNDGTIIKKEKR
jgi:hypothetical protein